MKVLVIVPAHNEDKSILRVINKLIVDCPTIDYIVINDCSSDETEKVLNNNNINHITLPVNLGIGGAIQTGYKYAVANGYDVAVQIDGDGQHDTKYILDVLKPIEEGKADLVIGSRFITKEGFQSSKMRRTGIRFLKVLIRLLCGIKINDTTSGFRATSKELTKYYSLHYAQDFPEPEAIVAAIVNGFTILEVPVVMFERMDGKSSIRASKSLYYMIKVSLAICLCRMSLKRKKR